VISWPAPSVPALPGRGEPVRLRDTATGRITPAAAGPAATLYVCGITPYDATHLGHAATYVAFDLLHRAWLDAGVEVRHVQNVTDVDDPLLERATARGLDWRELADQQTELFARDMTALSVLPPAVYLGATETVPLVVAACERMLAGGQAYRLDGDLYFDIASDPYFGEVAGLDPATMRTLSAERGGDPDRPGKRDPLDPLLWRARRSGEPWWDGGQIGPGRPGWHIECATIVLEHLGMPFDVQAGGSDLRFPHHEMGAAHAHVLTGTRPYARVYAHAGMVRYGGRKMSKSLGNLVLVSGLRDEGVDPAAIRLAILAHHYGRDWEWTPEVLAEAEKRLDRWRQATSRETGPPAGGVLAQVRRHLADDLDAPKALAAVDAWTELPLDAAAADAEAPGLIARIADALLGVRL
jgi:L-cysteine:1D-myo-inositol 2-amino-2-deoxy-alpha-D-glucopyranoside ligase